MWQFGSKGNSLTVGWRMGFLVYQVLVLDHIRCFGEGGMGGNLSQRDFLGAGELAQQLRGSGALERDLLLQDSS